MTTHSTRGRLRPRVFSTPRRLHPPSTCQPYFMLDPLLGLHPSKLFSSRVAVRCLQRLSPLAVKPSHRKRCDLSDFRVLLHTTVRHSNFDGLDRNPARSSPGFSVLQGVHPRWRAMAFTTAPLMDFLHADASDHVNRPFRVSSPAELACLSQDCRPSWTLPPFVHHKR